MDGEHRPLRTTTFPWAFAGLGVGAFAAVTIALVRALLFTPPPPVEVEVATAAVVEEVPVDAPLIDVPAARPVAAFDPIDVPWPPGHRMSSSTSTGPGR